MAKKNDTIFGLLIIVGFVIFLVSEVFKFIGDNIFIFGIITAICLGIFVILKIIEVRKFIKQEKEQNRQRIEINFNSKIDKIQKSKDYTLIKLKKIDDDLEEIEFKNSLSNEFYDSIEAISKLQNILNKANKQNKEIWNLFYDNSKFDLINTKNIFDKKIKELSCINEPKFFKQKKLSAEIEEKKVVYNQILKSHYDSSSLEISNKISLLKDKYKKKEKNWFKAHEEFEANKTQFNKSIDVLKSNYFEADSNAISNYNCKILESVTYDDHFYKTASVKYNNRNKTLIVEYLLPNKEQFPKIKEIRYIKTRKEFKEIKLNRKEFEILYEKTIYSITLDLIDKLFKNDFINLIDSIVFNGWSNSINRATGLYNKTCILSVVCEKKEFLKINLLEVEPKECFKKLKGISANKISNLTPIKPIISIENNDKRFVASQEIEIDYSTNLAAMHWEDFEHLIREVFEQEFSNNGGEVKVTQSSRDGGVDAIAYDPDPIRGGKIVIQAKRYTNIVGVSAVRDLYGTVMNEGATKGILVTTSDYGSDSFKFAKDKPITLLNGGNLLFLLEKHGYNARININEAKEALK